MRPSQAFRSGGGDSPIGKHGNYLGNWGGFGSPVQKQKGIATYGVAPNRQNPFAGAFHDAIFNSWRRFRNQVLYVAPPFFALYFALEWAHKRNHYLNSKAGRAETGSDKE